MKNIKKISTTNKDIRKISILYATEQLVLDNNQEIAIHEISKYLDIAKGSIYNHFESKNHLYLELIILNEKRLLNVTKTNNSNIYESVKAYMLYHILESNRTVIYHVIEERITNNEKKLQKIFQELYRIREQRALELKDLVRDYLNINKSHISVRDYLTYVWTITYGACLLLSSSSYQKSIGDRDYLIDFYIKKAFIL